MIAERLDLPLQFPKRVFDFGSGNCTDGWQKEDSVLGWCMSGSFGSHLFLPGQNIIPGTASAQRTGKHCSTVWLPILIEFHLRFEKLIIVDVEQFFEVDSYPF